MKQLIQNLKTGKTILEEVPVPMILPGQVLIKTHRSLVSLGTERMLVEFGKANYFSKARQQPEKVKQVIEKIKSDGLIPTVESVFRKLGEPLPLGYCNAGEVIGLGEGVTEFCIGDRVISNGNHAEIVSVSKNLVAKIPDNVPYDYAVYTVIGAIALQGIRLIKPEFGETVVVTGLGLIGLIAIQLLKANGCRVIGIDVDKNKLKIANELGIETIDASISNPVDGLSTITNSIGADAILITASNKGNDVISQSANMCRKRGRIVLIGVIGLNINRSDFYEKELSFQVSCSYGPGRYDPIYEDKGLDYPLAYVRWTEKRNFQTVLLALKNMAINVAPLTSEIVDLEEYKKVYSDMRVQGKMASILNYNTVDFKPNHSVKVTHKIFNEKKGIIGIIGAGNYTNAMILPILNKLNGQVKYIASSKGLSGTQLAKKHKIEYSTTNIKDIMSDEEVDTILITTRHQLHASQIIEGLKAGKHVFAEKPMALKLDEIKEIKKVYTQSRGSLTIGFNRRFSPFSIDAKIQINPNDEAINVIATMNAGHIPRDHWVHDMEIGGGRIIGEACHLVDLISYFTGSKVKRVVMNAMELSPTTGTDNASIILQYENGSNGVINYFSNGSKAYSKERIELYKDNKTAIIDNFRTSKYYGCPKKGFSSSQNKGQKEMFIKYIDQIKTGGPAIINFDEIVNTSKTTILALESLQTRSWIDV